MPLALAVAVGLVAYNTVTSLLAGDGWYVARNLVAAAALLWLAHWTGVSWEELGLGPGQVASGWRWGAGAALAVAVAVATAAALVDRLPLVASLMSDVRADLPPADLGRQVVVRIPLGTAVFEEVAFRGVLLALFLEELSPIAAIGASAVPFGLWHVAPTIVTLRLNHVDVTAKAGLAAIGGGVALTTVGGIVFGVLRLGSGSLLAPALAHWAVNGITLLAAALLRGPTR